MLRYLDIATKYGPLAEQEILLRKNTLLRSIGCINIKRPSIDGPVLELKHPLVQYSRYYVVLLLYLFITVAKMAIKKTITLFISK